MSFSRLKNPSHRSFRHLAPLAAIAVALLVTGCTTAPSSTLATQVEMDTSQSVATRTANQLRYALAHWNNYNTAEWGDLNPVGGDCANFVSQALIARGWKMNDEWYSHNAGADWSSPWGYVPAMDAYLRANAAQLGLTEHPLEQRDDITVGDIVMFDWNDNDSLDHVAMVSAVERVNGTVQIKMVSHNKDTDYHDLDVTIAENPGVVGHFWSLSK